MLRAIVFCCTLLQPPAGKLTLAASKSSAYAGELVELILTIETTTQTQAELTLPWRVNDPGWEQQSDWSKRYSQASPSSFPFRWQNRTLYAPSTKPGVYELRWKYRVPSARDGDVLNFSSVSLSGLASNTVQLEIKPLPVMLPAPGEWYLGTGPFSVTVRWLPEMVALGEETTLEFIITGQGDLRNVTSPKLNELPGWEASKVLLENKPTLQEENKKVFRFSVRPRQQVLSLSTPRVRYFDPGKERWVTQSVTIAALKISSASMLENIPAGSTLADARRHLPELVRHSLEEQETNGWHQQWSVSLAIIPHLAIMILIAVWGYWNWQAQTMTEAKRWRWAVRSARRKLRTMLFTPDTVFEQIVHLLNRSMDYRGQPEYRSLMEAAATTPLSMHLHQVLELAQRWKFGPNGVDGVQVARAFEELLRKAEHLP